MEQIKGFLKYSQTLSALGIIIILFSVLDYMGARFLTLNFKLAPAVFILGLYHVLVAAVELIEPES